MLKLHIPYGSPTKSVNRGLPETGTPPRTSTEECSVDGRSTKHHLGYSLDFRLRNSRSMVGRLRSSLSCDRACSVECWTNRCCSLSHDQRSFSRWSVDRIPWVQNNSLNANDPRDMKIFPQVVWSSTCVIK